MESKREFYVETPLGRIKVWAKHEDGNDVPDDFPGVYIDFIPKHKPDLTWANDQICCVEYNPIDECIKSVLYQPGVDEPTDIVAYEWKEENEEDSNA